METHHSIICGDARDMSALDDGSVHLVVTSPPYWTLKEYNDIEGQLGHVEDYGSFLANLDRVWRECFRVLVPGGRLCINVGDVCLSRRAHGRHRVVPLHADISRHCIDLGFDYLTPIYWWKVSNINLEASNSSRYLGKPCEPNGVIKNDIEYILLFRKGGAYRKPTPQMRRASVISKEEYAVWFSQVWTDISGTSSGKHPAPFPVELPYRLIRMFSFAGDMVLDPFCGTGTTGVAAARAGRNSVGYEIDPTYVSIARRRLLDQTGSLLSTVRLSVFDARGTAATPPPEPHLVYSVNP